MPALELFQPEHVGVGLSVGFADPLGPVAGHTLMPMSHPAVALLAVQH